MLPVSKKKTVAACERVQFYANHKFNSLEVNGLKQERMTRHYLLPSAAIVMILTFLIAIIIIIFQCPFEFLHEIYPVLGIKRL